MFSRSSDGAGFLAQSHAILIQHSMLQVQEHSLSTTWRTSYIALCLSSIFGVGLKIFVPGQSFLSDLFKHPHCPTNVHTNHSAVFYLFCILTRDHTRTSIVIGKRHSTEPQARLVFIS